MSQKDDVVALAKKMARAAGKQKADILAQAAYMLICTAAMVKDPEGYFKWLDEVKPAPTLTNPDIQTITLQAKESK